MTAPTPQKHNDQSYILAGFSSVKSPLWDTCTPEGRLKLANDVLRYGRKTLVRILRVYAHHLCTFMQDDIDGELGPVLIRTVPPQPPIPRLQGAHGVLGDWMDKAFLLSTLAGTGTRKFKKKKERDQELAKLYRGLLEILFKLFRSDRKEVKKRFLNMRLPKKELAMWKSLRFGSNSVRFWPQASAEEKKSVDRYAYSRDLTIHIPYLCQALNLCVHTAKTHFSTAPDRILDPEFRSLLVFTFALFPITAKMDEWIDEAVGAAPSSSLGAPPRCFSAQCKNTENLGLCQGCCVAVYCGTACQRRDWGHHMNVCFKWKDYYPQLEEEIFKEEPIKLFVRVKKNQQGKEQSSTPGTPPSELVDLNSPRSTTSSSPLASPETSVRQITGVVSPEPIDLHGGLASPEPVSPRVASPDPMSPRLGAISPDPVSPSMSPEPRSPIDRSQTPSPCSMERSESPSPLSLGPTMTTVSRSSEAQIRALVLGRTIT